MGPSSPIEGFAALDTKFNGIYRGTVMDNEDPDQYGKVKVKIYPMFNELATADLPWAAPASGISDGASAGFGSFTVPIVGSNVFCFFEAGDMYQPVYFAEAPDAVKGLPTSRTTNYPKRRVIKFSSGIEMIVDTETNDILITTPLGNELKIRDGLNQIEVNHSTGALITIDTLGQLNIACSKLNVVTSIPGSTGVATLNISGDCDVLATGDITLAGANVHLNP